MVEIELVDSDFFAEPGVFKTQVNPGFFASFQFQVDQVIQHLLKGPIFFNSFRGGLLKVFVKGF